MPCWTSDWPWKKMKYENRGRRGWHGWAPFHSDVTRCWFPKLRAFIRNCCSSRRVSFYLIFFKNAIPRMRFAAPCHAAMLFWHILTFLFLHDSLRRICNWWMSWDYIMSSGIEPNPATQTKNVQIQTSPLSWMEKIRLMEFESGEDPHPSTRKKTFLVVLTFGIKLKASLNQGRSFCVMLGTEEQNTKNLYTYIDKNKIQFIIIQTLSGLLGHSVLTNRHLEHLDSLKTFALIWGSWRCLRARRGSSAGCCFSWAMSPLMKHGIL